MHLLLYVRNTRRAGDEDNLGAILKLAPGLLLGSALLIVAGALDGDARTLLWIVALADRLRDAAAVRHRGVQHPPGPLRRALRADHDHRPGRVDRRDRRRRRLRAQPGRWWRPCSRSPPSPLWWAYFDIVAIVAERRLTEAPPGEQAPLARDSYCYIHFPMIAGIVLFALGVKKTELAVDEPLKTIPAFALCGGVALYLLGHIAFRYRNVGTFNRHRAVAAVAVAGPDPAGARGRRPARAGGGRPRCW